MNTQPTPAPRPGINARARRALARTRARGFPPTHAIRRLYAERAGTPAPWVVLQPKITHAAPVARELGCPLWYVLRTLRRSPKRGRPRRAREEVAR